MGSREQGTVAPALVERVLALADATPQRVIIGIAGSPGSGKTTVAVGLVERLCAARHDTTRPDPTGAAPFAAHVPMDGFHLADVELDRLGSRARKGAPDTIDGWGYLALLERLRRTGRGGETVYAPGFERDLEQALAGAIPVEPEVRVVVTEGNYLLLDHEPWRSLRTVLDEVWFCRIPHEVRTARLVARHRRFGKSDADARAWVAGPDEANALIVEATAVRADLVLADGTPEPDQE